MTDLVPFVRPKPTCEFSMATHVTIAGQTVTSILRKWSPGDAARCPRCPKCHAFEDVCLISVLDYVATVDTPDFTRPPAR